MLIAQGHIIKPMNFPKDKLFMCSMKLSIAINQTHQIYLEEEPPVRESFGACITGLASHQIFDEAVVMLVLNCGISRLTTTHQIQVVRTSGRST